MARKKVKLAYIANDSARKATYNKRKNGLLKKVSQLSTLCDVPACAIIYNPFEPEVDLFPSTRDVHRVIDQFKSMPEVDRGKYMMNQESFLKTMITKKTDQLREIYRDNQENYMKEVMFNNMISQTIPNNITLDDLRNLQWAIEHHLREIGKALSKININNNDNLGPLQGNEAPVSQMPGTTSGPVSLPPLPISLSLPHQDEMMAAPVTQEPMDMTQSLMEFSMNQQENDGFGGNGLNQSMIQSGDQTTFNSSMWFNNNYHQG